MPQIKLEVGKIYRNREGFVTPPLEANPHSSRHPFKSGKFTYMESGRNDEKGLTSIDLVEEVSDDDFIKAFLVTNHGCGVSASAEKTKKLTSQIQSFADRLRNDARSSIMFEADWDTLMEVKAQLKALQMKCDALEGALKGEKE